MQTREIVEGLHNCLEFSRPSLCLDEAIHVNKVWILSSGMSLEVTSDKQNKTLHQSNAIATTHALDVAVVVILISKDKLSTSFIFVYVSFVYTQYKHKPQHVFRPEF